MTPSRRPSVPKAFPRSKTMDFPRPTSWMSRCRRYVFLLPVLLLLAAPAGGQEQLPPAPEPSPPTAALPPQQEFKRFEFEFEPDAYYTNASLIISLTRDPIPQLGEQPEEVIYRTLMSRAFSPRFLLLEASVNPLPYLGVYIKKNHPSMYRNGDVSGSFNWISALTAGFEEPWALSLFAGNVVDFDIAGEAGSTGKGYSGYLVSTGKYHIKDNELIRDRWWEFEWKLKGDRKSTVKKLNWSFRIGAKLHMNAEVTDIIYLSFRRSRVDYRPESGSYLNNSGFEYTFDMNRSGLDPIRHYFFVDKKWPYPERQFALTMALGFVWESGDKYSGALGAGRTSTTTIILRPNIEF